MVVPPAVGPEVWIVERWESETMQTSDPKHISHCWPTPSTKKFFDAARQSQICTSSAS